MNKTKREMERDAWFVKESEKARGCCENCFHKFINSEVNIKRGWNAADANPSPQVEALLEALSLTNRPAFTISHFTGAEKANAMLDQWLDELLANYRASMKLGNGDDT